MFSWDVGDWGSCDATCSGYRTRQVRCTVQLKGKRILVRTYEIIFNL